MVEIKDSYFKAPDGNRYFRRNAPAVSVGSYGEKKTPITQANYLAVDGHLKFEYLDGKLLKIPPVTIDWERESTADVEASAKQYFDLGGVKLTFSHQVAKSAHLKLVRFHVESSALESILNNQAGAVREAMKSEGGDARICSSVWIVISAKLSERFNTSVGIDVSATTTNGMKITVKGGGNWQGSEVITLDAGTVFAYGLHKVDKWNGAKVESLEDDWQSLG